MDATFEIFIGQDIIFKFFCTLWHTWFRIHMAHDIGIIVPYGCQTMYSKMCGKMFNELPVFLNLLILPPCCWISDIVHNLGRKSRFFGILCRMCANHKQNFYFRINEVNAVILEFLLFLSCPYRKM